MSAKIYLEGGGDSKDLHVRCREGFRKLVENWGFSGRMPKLVACGGRGAAYDDFQTGHATSSGNDYVALWIDSEDPIADVERTWQHLAQRDGWQKPDGAIDEQVLLMTTCMETWIVCDRKTLSEHYRPGLQASALPAIVDLEKRTRGFIQDALTHATCTCPNAYAKGKRSFEVLGKLDPAALDPHLPSFARVGRILRAKL